MPTVKTTPRPTYTTPRIIVTPTQRIVVTTPRQIITTTRRYTTTRPPVSVTVGEEYLPAPECPLGGKGKFYQTFISSSYFNEIY